MTTTSSTPKSNEQRESLSDNARRSGEEIKRRADETVASAGERIGDAYEHSRAAVADQVENLEASVKKAPLKSVAIAAGVGIAVGLLLNRG